jgi:hypothetical protein
VLKGPKKTEPKSDDEGEAQPKKKTSEGLTAEEDF